jgi:hypothetical protein
VFVINCLLSTGHLSVFLLPKLDYVCMCVCVYVHVCMYVYVRTYVCIMYVCMYMCVCVKRTKPLLATYNHFAKKNR